MNRSLCASTEKYVFKTPVQFMCCEEGLSLSRDVFTFRLTGCRTGRVSCCCCMQGWVGFVRWSVQAADPVDDSAGLYDGLVAASLPQLPPPTAAAAAADTPNSGLSLHGPITQSSRRAADRSPSKSPLHGVASPSRSAAPPRPGTTRDPASAGRRPSRQPGSTAVSASSIRA